MIYIVIGVVVFAVVMFFMSIFNSHKTIVKLYNKYMNIKNEENAKGSQIVFFAAKIFGLKVKVAKTRGLLTDGYSPKGRLVILSEEVCDNASIASAAIVAHEMGHAVQHKNKSLLFRLNYFLRRFCRIFCKFALPCFILGGVRYWCGFDKDTGYAMLIISLVFVLLYIFQKLIEIPLEKNASDIGYKFLTDYNLVSKWNARKVKKLLKVAGRTYTAEFFRQLLPIRRNF